MDKNTKINKGLQLLVIALLTYKKRFH